MANQLSIERSVAARNELKVNNRSENCFSPCCWSPNKYFLSSKMAQILLIADSNYKNNVNAYKGKKIKNLEVKSCQSRKSAVAEFSAVEEGIVVISCLDMIAADIAKSTIAGADNAVEVYFNQLVYKLVDKVDESDGRVAFGVVAPLFWKSHSKEIQRAMNHTYKLLMKSPLNNIWFSDYVKDVKAGVDGTHLTEASANRYIEHINNFFQYISNESGLKYVEIESQVAEDGNAESGSNWAEERMDQDGTVEDGIELGPPAEEVLSPARTPTMLSPSILQQSTSTQRPNPNQAPSERPLLTDTQARLVQLAGQLPDLSVPPPNPVQNLAEVNVSFAKMDRRLNSLENKAHYSNVMTAILKEEIDTEANKAMLNKITISGVAIENITNMDEQRKIRVMRSKVEEIFDLLKEPNQEFEIQFVRHLNNQVRGQKTSVLEVRLPDAKQAKDIRQEFVKKSKSLKEKINITPVVRLATRVRVEIMHSVCEAMKKQDKSITKANCLQFVPKPVIKVTRKMASGAESTQTMSFIDAVNWVYANGLEQTIHLGKARARAGASFRGTLAQHFVLLE